MFKKAFILIILFSSISFAQNYNFFEAEMLINSIDFGNRNIAENTNYIRLQSLIPNLTSTEKSLLYSENKQDGAKYMFFNIFPFAVGSIVQRDWLSVAVAVPLESIGIIMIASTLLIAQNARSEDIPVGEKYNVSSINVTQTTFVTIGSVMFLSGYIFALIRPMLYSSKYNLNLADSLSPKNNPVSFSLLPYIAPDDFNGMQGGLAFNIKF